MASRIELGCEELAALKILDQVDLPTVKVLLEHCELRTLAPGEVLLRMGEPNSTMYMVLAGRLSVHLEGGPTSEPVTHISAGETVGELSVLEASTASANVVAVFETRVLAVDDRTFWSLVDASHDFAINLLLLLAGRLRRNNATVANNIRLQREYKRSALVDALTGLYNRRWLDDALPRFVKRFARSGGSLAVLVVDVDHFKRVNDTYGHPVGDAVLMMVAHTLRESLRPTDHVARFGGEEFVVILPDTNLAGVSGVAERLRLAVRAAPALTADGALPSVSVSIGGATLRGDEQAAALLARADAALYASKGNGRDRVTMSTP